MKRGMILILCLILLLLPTGCGKEEGWKGSYRYDDAEEYVCGEAALTESVSALEIHWVAGSVRLAYHDEDTVAFSESSMMATEKETSLYYRVKEGVLTIQFAKSGHVDLVNLKKDLTVYLPRGTRPDRLGLHLISAEAQIEPMQVTALAIETVSGDVTFEGGEVASAVIDTVSGDVSVSGDVIMETAAVETVSGKIELRMPAIRALMVDSVSGNVTYRQGEVLAEASVTAQSVSGDLNLYLPEGIGMQVVLEGVGKNIESTLAMTENGEGKYLIGEGGARLLFESVSGDLHLYKQEVTA